MDTVNGSNTEPKMLAYASEDVDRIISGTLGDVAFLGVPARIHLKKNFESNCFINLSLHLTLLEYYKNKVTSETEPFPPKKGVLWKIRGVV